MQMYQITGEYQITESLVNRSLAHFNSLDNATDKDAFPTGSLCADSPLSLAIAKRLPGAIVSINGQTIRVDHGGYSAVIPIPASYREFDRAFCNLIYAMRTTSKKVKVNPESLRKKLFSLLPLTAFVTSR